MTFVQQNVALSAFWPVIADMFTVIIIANRHILIQSTRYQNIFYLDLSFRVKNRAQQLKSMHSLFKTFWLPHRLRFNSVINATWV